MDCINAFEPCGLKGLSSIQNQAACHGRIRRDRAAFVSLLSDDRRQRTEMVILSSASDLRPLIQGL